MRVWVRIMAVAALSTAISAGSAWNALGQDPVFQGDMTNAWFKVHGPIESRGMNWDSNEIQRMKQGVTFYLHIIPGSEQERYKAEIYSYLYNGHFEKKCWQKQGEADGIQVSANEAGNDAFFFFAGDITNYHDDEAGNWCPDDSQGIVWGTVRLLKKDTKGDKFDKMKIEFRMMNVFDDGSVQFGMLKGKTKAPLAEDAICEDSCPAGP